MSLEIKKSEIPESQEEVVDYSQEKITSQEKIIPEQIRELAKALKGEEGKTAKETHNVLVELANLAQKTRISKKIFSLLRIGSVIGSIFIAETSAAESVLVQQSHIEQSTLEKNRETRQEKENTTLELSNETKKTLQNLLSNDDSSLRIQTVRGMEKIDDEEIDSEWLKEEASPFILEGRTHSIQYKTELTLGEFEKLNLNEKTNWSKKQNQQMSGSFVFRDKYDNYIFVYVNKDIEKERVKMGIYVDTRAKYASSEKQSPSLQPVSVDLSYIGMGHLENIVYQQELEHVGKIYDIDTYHEGMDKNTAKKLIEKYSIPIHTGVDRAAKLFNNSDKMIPKRIIVSGDYSHLHMLGLEKAMVIGQDFLDDYDLEDNEELEVVQDAVSHEVFHAVDYHFQISDDKKIIELFMSTDTDILENLSEKNFSDDNEGGHAEDSKSEMVASFFNSLDLKNWEDNIKEKNENEKKFYISMCKTVKEILTSNLKFESELKGAPIFSLLEEKIVFLEKNISEKK